MQSAPIAGGSPLSRPGSWQGGRWLVPLAVALLAAAAHGRTIGHGFINIDDALYVTENPAVRRGFTADGLAQAFGFMASNWHPVTWISHMADVQVFGLHPWGHHLVSVALHALNAVLVLIVLRRMTGAYWPSALAAAIFAVHPLGVESVAWIAERKSLLSTFFFWLTLGAWVSWVRLPTARRYAAVVALFALAVMSKPMVVTLPFLLLVLDWWPLGRLGWRRELPHHGLGRLALEKLPLMALSVLGSATTLVAQAVGMEDVAFPARVANAVVSYGDYLLMMFWPARLGVLYPYPVRGIPAPLIGASALLLLFLTLAVFLLRARKPFLAAGWLWYLGTLVPVIGLVQVGVQARADRYTYIPLAGVLLALCWLWGDALSPARPWRQVGAAATGGVVVALALTAFVQAGYWRDDLALMEHTTRVTKGNWFTLNNLGIGLIGENRLGEAQSVLEEALRIKPDHANAIYNLGTIYSRRGRWREAAGLYLKALSLDPDRPDTWINLGLAQFNMGLFGEAAESFRRAEVDPTYRNVGGMLRSALSMQERQRALERP